MREVYSTRVSKIGWENGELHVRWAKGGKTSIFTGVPEKVADDVMNAASVGQALAFEIEGRYEMRYG